MPWHLLGFMAWALSLFWLLIVKTRHAVGMQWSRIGIYGCTVCIQ